MKTRKFAPSLFALLLGALSSAAAVPADKPAKVKYVPPTGFGGHQWGELRAGFERLPGDPMGVGAAFTGAVVKNQDFICKPVFSEAQQGCDMYTMIMTMSKTYEGGGFYVLSEYSIEGQGFRYGDEANGVVLHPIVYQFCANWDDTKKVVPEKFDEMNKFCGVRLMFRSETREQLRKLPGDYVTNYDRILEMLLERFGKPDGFIHRGRVVIETLEGESSDAADRKFSIWRWCPARDRSLHTSCTASVVLSLDPATGIGTVLYSTPLLWEYAYARQNGGFKGDKLFKMLHARN
jgi:hypothetical protein